MDRVVSVGEDGDDCVGSRGVNFVVVVSSDFVSKAAQHEQLKQANQAFVLQDSESLSVLARAIHRQLLKEACMIREKIQ
jgi:UDP-N-acetyl-D-mannosaminuronic acid transferase (WecB/TagA/CpsF family)